MLLLYALISLFGWAFSDIFGTVASRRLGSFNTAFYTYLMAAIVGLFYVPFSLNSLSHFTGAIVFLTIFLAIIQSLSFFAFSEGLKIGNSSIVGTIAGAFTSVVVILSVLFLGDRLNIPQIIAILVIFIGLFFTSINISAVKNISSLINKGNFYALVAMAGWGIYFTFIKIPVEHAGFFWPTMITNVTGTVFFFLFGVKKIKIAKKYRRHGIPQALAGGMIGSIASFSFNYAIGRGMTSIVAPIAGAYPALFALLAYVYFKDPLVKQQKAGMLLTLLGILVLSYLSS